MGEDCGSWIPQQNFHWQSPKLNFSIDLGHRNAMSAFMNSGANLVPTNRTLPVYAFPEVPHSRVGQVNEPHGWFYCLPRFRQALRPVSNSLLKEKLPATPYENCKEAITSNMGPGCAQKSFIVFDQSRDQTTLMFSSGIGAPVQCLNPWTPKPPAAYNLSAEHHDLNHRISGPILTDEFCENHKTDVQSEMHEDTEELNALLYSDDDSDSTEDDDDDEEVTSTGHSPSTMTAHDKPDWFNGSTEEVASSAGPTRKRKLFDGGYDDVPTLVDTATSAKPKKSFEYEDDAESSCGDGKNQIFKSDNKRMKKEKIRETVSILQDLIPGGKGKDAIEVLDEAINYLKSLKYKATALGLNSL